ncbi:MAG TPA: hypothetical protein VJB92_03135 [Candidatus Paceibacterota bacterium]
MIKNIIFAVIAIGVAGLLIFYAPQGDSGLPEAEGKVWLSIMPIQCQGNPWEEQQSRNYLGPPDLKLTEVNYVKNYYDEQGITIFEVKFIQPSPETAVCLACSCPRGDTLYVQVADKDVTKMLSFGYKKVE